MPATVLPPAAFGVSGDTTTTALARIASWALDDTVGVTATPDVGIIYIGVNDPINSITQATTQANIQAMILAAKHGAYGEPNTQGGATVAGQASLPATGRAGQRYVVLADTSTTGGAAAWHPSQTATITGAAPASGLSVWEFRWRRTGEGGWGRVATSATPPTVCQRLLIVSTNYKNYATNGSGNAATLRDTLATPEPQYAAVRAAQQAAVTAENASATSTPWVQYVDLYGLQRTLIVGGGFGGLAFAAGTVPDFSGGAAYDATKDWHYTSGNQHHGIYGHQLVALACYLAITGTTSWVNALKVLPMVNVKALGDSQTDYNAGYARAIRTWAPTLGHMLRDYFATLG